MWTVGSLEESKADFCGETYTASMLAISSFSVASAVVSPFFRFVMAS